MHVSRVVSGGQTGVDRAALDVALELGLPCSGWCPKGRLAEDGCIDPRYPLRETPSQEYAQRTEWNVRDSDGTLIVTRRDVTGGTAQTVDVAKQLGKPYLVLNLAEQPDESSVERWVRHHEIRVLNVAGPRESGASGIYAEAVIVLRRVLAFLIEC